MANFEEFYKKLSLNEGGYTNHKDDAGNWTGGRVGVGVLIGTNHGVSAPVLRAYLKRDITVEDMKNLSKETAKKIMKSLYWDVVHADKITDQGTAEDLADHAVNGGHVTAVKLMQRSLGIKETGAMNTETLNKINNV